MGMVGLLRDNGKAYSGISSSRAAAAGHGQRISRSTSADRALGNVRRITQGGFEPTISNLNGRAAIPKERAVRAAGAPEGTFSGRQLIRAPMIVAVNVRFCGVLPTNRVRRDSLDSPALKWRRGPTRCN